MDESLIKFSRGVPPAESFPQEALVSCAERVIHQSGAQILQYGNGAGYHPLCNYIADQLHVNVQRVLVGQGSLQLLDHLCRVRLSAGDRVFIEQPTYDRTITLFKRAGAELIGFDIQKGHIDIEAVRDTLKKGVVPRFFYVIPDFQNPSGSTMPLETRVELVVLARQYGFTIIEDGPYRHLRYEGEQLPALIELAPEDVIHMSSFSKLISPGLRTGYMALPDGLAEDVIAFATDTYISPSMFDQALVLEFLGMGLLDGHITHLKNIFQPRLDALLSALDAHLPELGSWTRPQGGYYVGFSLHDTIEKPDFAGAEKFGLQLSAGQGFFLSGGERFLRLPFCALTEAQILDGIIRLKTMITPH